MVSRIAAAVGVNSVTGDLGLRDVRTGKRPKGSAPKDFLAIKAEELKPGTAGIYEFANKILARHGAMLQPTTDRDRVSIQAPDFDQEPSYTIARTLEPSPASLVVESTATRDYSKLPTFGEVRAKVAKQGKPARAVTFTVDVVKGASGEMGRILKGAFSGRQKLGSEARIEAGQLYRLLSFKDDQARNEEQARRALNRAIADRVKDSLRYTVTLAGLKSPETGAYYAANTMARVRDEACDIDETLWVESVELEAGGSGKRAKLTCYRPESFKL